MDINDLETLRIFITDAKKSEISSLEIATKFDLSHDKAIGRINSLKSRGKITVRNESVTLYTLTPEGIRYAKEKLPEMKVV